MPRQTFRRTPLPVCLLALLTLLALVTTAGRAHAAGATAAGSFSESELWDSTDSDAYASFHVQGLGVIPQGIVPPAGGAALPADVVLTFTEGRFTLGDGGPKDLLVRRSVDAGVTWSASAVVVPQDAVQSWGDPTPVVDRQTGRVSLFWKGDGSNIYVKHSDDAGATWSATEDLTPLFASNPYGWTRDAPIPGHGIQLSSGRLLMPVMHRAASTATDANYGVDMLYSDDHGTTWHRGSPLMDATYPVNESRIYERSDGAVVLNGRWGSGGTRYRITSTSTDGGLTWSAPAIDGATGTFSSVDAGMLNYTSGTVDRLLFSRPDSSARENMTVSISYDDGASFRYSRVVDPGTSYYSDLARLSDGTILLVYGRDGTVANYPERIAVARFDLAWLTKGRDSLATGPGFTQQSYEMATSAARTDTGAAVPILTDANATGGKALRYGASAVGNYVDVPFTVTQAGDYQVSARFHRSFGQGQIRASVDGTTLSQGLFDPTLTSGSDTYDIDGYQVYPLGSTTLAAGQHTVRFTLAAVGRASGKAIAPDQLTLVSGGEPADVPTTVSDNDFIPGFDTLSGTWTDVNSLSGAYGNSHDTHAAGTGTASVEFRPDVPMNGVYEVAAWFKSASGQASNASYVIDHADGQTAVTVNEASGGGRWVRLGEFAFTGGGDATVTLSDNADGTIVADAVRLSYRGAVTDNGSSGFSTVSGTWNAGTTVTGYQGANYLTHAAGTGTSAVRWQTDVPTTGTYDVSVWYTDNANRADNAPYTVTDADGSTLVPVNQQVDGGRWISLGKYSFTAGSKAVVQLSDDADGYVVADAVRITAQGLVADNDDPSTYSVVSGTWNPASTVKNYWGTSYRTHAAGTGTSVVRWQSNVPASGVYDVAVWYTADANRATNAPYTVRYPGGSAVVRVDQTERGNRWVSLGSFPFTAGTPAVVELSDDANGYVVADAVRFIG
ncbi:exo-alpha-sialidase [Streptomyces sp. MBT65]|uniref:golvesin C-terminal-like domain-containing protein n=1 Tax=Streptomyces sp. MBT65 TaxID=1488395 RepID=UPI00190DC14C|nr:exo-alpha-sialidase [Streptomyces sp. MBT65]MBK3576873.1 exo-alpha-sialidase [Streptomyces sp. MBT65]